MRILRIASNDTNIRGIRSYSRKFALIVIYLRWRSLATSSGTSSTTFDQ